MIREKDELKVEGDSKEKDNGKRCRHGHGCPGILVTKSSSIAMYEYKPGYA